MPAIFILVIVGGFAVMLTSPIWFPPFFVYTRLSRLKRRLVG